MRDRSFSTGRPDQVCTLTEAPSCLCNCMIVCIPEIPGIEPSIYLFKYRKCVVGMVTNGYVTRDTTILGNKAVLVAKDF